MYWRCVLRGFHCQVPVLSKCNPPLSCSIRVTWMAFWTHLQSVGIDLDGISFGPKNASIIFMVACVSTNVVVSCEYQAEEYGTAG